MRILVLANRDLAANLALNLLLPGLAGHQVKLLLSASVGSATGRPRELQWLKFFEQDLFNELVFPLRDAASGAGGPQSFTGLGQWLAQPPAIENAINSPESLARIREFAPDLVLSIRYGGILREEVIGLPRLGVVNLHSGVLPDYRGVMATFRAMLAGESELGATLHYIEDASIDTGGVLRICRVPADYQRSYLWNVLQLYPPACAAMLEIVEGLESGDALAVMPQGEGGAYFSFPEQAELDAFRARGLALVDPADILEIAPT